MANAMDAQDTATYGLSRSPAAGETAGMDAREERGRRLTEGSSGMAECGRGDGLKAGMG